MRNVFWLTVFLPALAAAVPLKDAEYRWSTQSEWQSSPPPRPQSGGVFHLRLRVPQLGPNPTVSIPLVSGRLSASLDGAPLELDGPWALVALPPDSAGRWLEVTYDTFWPPRNVGLRFGSRAELLDEFADDLRAFAIGLGMFLLGVLVCLSVLGRGGRGWFFFGAFSTCMGLMKAGQSWAVYPVALPLPELMTVGHELTIWLVSAALGSFVAELFGGRWEKWLRRVAWLGVAGGVVAVALDLLKLVGSPRLRVGADVVILVELGLIFAAVTPLARRGDHRARLVLLGMAGQLVFAVPELLHGLHIGQADTAYLGTLALILCLGLALRRQFAENNDRLVDTTRALEAQVAQLDARNAEVATLNAELRHQVAERSRELAKVLATSLDGQRLATDSRKPAEASVVGGRYRIQRALGQGAMGSVHEAERLSDGLKVAVKVLHSVRDAADAARFAREAEIASRVHHPNLVGVLDVGMTTTGSPYLVMEHVSGGTLAAQATRFGQVPVVLPWLLGISKALEALHAAGIVHRDLKPANVLLAEQQGALVPRLADFGISRLESVADVDAETMARGERLTRTGAFLGTPLYMAPEQATNAAGVGPSADLFAFGVMAYELLTGQVPFLPPAVFRVMAHAPIPPPALKLAKLAGLPPAVGATLDACLSMDPSARPEAATLVQVLAVS